MKFAGLSRYASQIISIECEKALKFQEGLAPYIKSRIAPFMIIEYAEALERALVIDDTSGGPMADRRQQKKRSTGQDGLGGAGSSTGSPASKKPRTVPPLQ